MKKLISLFLALSMLLTATVALADGRTAPEDKKIIEDDAIGIITYFRKYDAKFWDAASEQPGTVERMEYTTDVYGDTVTNYLSVYLPYGYDASQQYNIIYFFHGTNETPESFIEDERAKNCLDNMIETGVAEPFIMVFPTYYYNYAERATNKELFCEEMRKDIMPLVESTYSTYAETADDAGFQASREHRAIGGYSQGSQAAWVAFAHLMDTARWWLPMSLSTAADQVLAALDAQPGYKDDFFLYVSTGGKRDLAYEGTVAMAKELLEKHSDVISYGMDPSVNNFAVLISNEIHQTLIGRYYFYNAFIDVLFK